MANMPFFGSSNSLVTIVKYKAYGEHVLHSVVLILILGYYLVMLYGY